MHNLPIQVPYSLSLLIGNHVQGLLLGSIFFRTGPFTLPFGVQEFSTEWLNLVMRINENVTGH